MAKNDSQMAIDLSDLTASPSGALVGAGAGATGFDTSAADAWLATKTTDDLSEGVTNLYFHESTFLAAAHTWSGVQRFNGGITNGWGTYAIDSNGVVRSNGYGIFVTSLITGLTGAATNITWSPSTFIDVAAEYQYLSAFPTRIYTGSTASMHMFQYTILLRNDDTTPCTVEVDLYYAGSSQYAKSYAYLPANTGGDTGYGVANFYDVRNLNPSSIYYLQVRGQSGSGTWGSGCNFRILINSHLTMRPVS